MNKRPQMDFFSILPSEIIIDIFLRLNVGNIMKCKKVCKSWLYLVGTDHFVSSHLCRSVPGLLVREREADSCRFLEFEEGNENQHYTGDDKYNIEMSKLHLNSAMSFNIPLCKENTVEIHSSANGLLFLVKTERMGYKYESNYICNPITRNYINICCHCACHSNDFVGYGFGVSKLGKYTVLRIHQKNRGREKHINCDVYNLGSGSWRSVAPPDPSLCCDANTPFEFVKYMEDGPCLDGRFHWLNLHRKPHHVLCFDLETELFSIYDLPLPFEVGKNWNAALTALGNSLCLCDTMSGNEIIIWLAEERGGVEKSWIKEFVIPKTQGLLYYPLPCSNFLFNVPLSVINVFKNGDILMKYQNSLFLYHPYKNTIYELDCWKRRIRYTPSFLSLASFSMENAISF